MIDSTYALKAIVAMALVTFALRALPFVAAEWIEHHPVVRRLGRFLPLAIMLLLVLHSALGAARAHAGAPWPELAGVALTAALQGWRKNALLSILAGTGHYVLLRNGF